MSDLKFTEFFGKSIHQNQLDFVNIFAYKDLPVFLDPYGISAIGTEWSQKCEMSIRSYFQYLIESIQKNKVRQTNQLLDALHEVNEIGLGYSRGIPKGRGIGKEQSNILKEIFQRSSAMQSGDIRDIADCALLIPGINRDKISDITANILKKELIEFTMQQCRILDIPMSRVPMNNIFQSETGRFVSSYEFLPIIEGSPKILLPISSVRRQPELSKETFYRKYILEYLRAEHLHAGDSLAFVLKNGALRVSIKDLKMNYPMSVDLIYKFSKNNPDVLGTYKKFIKTECSGS